MVIMAYSRAPFRCDPARARSPRPVFFLCAEQRQQPVETAATGENTISTRFHHLENKAGIIVERTTERRAIGDGFEVNARVRKSCDTFVESGKRSVQFQLRLRSKIGQNLRGLRQRRLQSEELLQQRKAVIR